MCASFAKLILAFQGEEERPPTPPPLQDRLWEAPFCIPCPSLPWSFSPFTPLRRLSLGSQGPPHKCFFLSDHSREESRGVRVLIPAPLPVLALLILHVLKSEDGVRGRADASSVLRLANPPAGRGTCVCAPPTLTFLPTSA